MNAELWSCLPSFVLVMEVFRQAKKGVTLVSVSVLKATI